MEPYLQFGPHTSETIKLLSKQMSKVPGLKEYASPAKIENLVRGYTGGFGKMVLDAADKFIEAVGIVKTPPKPPKTLADMPGVRAFVQRFPTANTKSIERFYEEYTKLKRKFESRKEEVGLRGIDRMRRIMGGKQQIRVPRPPKLIIYEQVAKRLSDLRAVVRHIMKSKTMTPEQKQRAINACYIMMINTARVGLNKKPLPRLKK